MRLYIESLCVVSFEVVLQPQQLPQHQQALQHPQLDHLSLNLSRSQPYTGSKRSLTFSSFNCHLEHPLVKISLLPKAQFLIQSTFGPTLASLKALETMSKSFQQWIDEQIMLPVESHREYWRKRTNPYVSSKLGLDKYHKNLGGI